MFARYMTHCKTSSVVYLIYHCIVVFEDVSWNLRAEEWSVRKYQVNVSKWFLILKDFRLMNTIGVVPSWGANVTTSLALSKPVSAFFVHSKIETKQRSHAQPTGHASNKIRQRETKRWRKSTKCWCLKFCFTLFQGTRKIVMPFKCCRGDWNRKTGATCNGLSRTQPPLHHDFAYPKVHPNRRQSDPAHSKKKSPERFMPYYVHLRPQTHPACDPQTLMAPNYPPSTYLSISSNISLRFIRCNSLLAKTSSTQAHHAANTSIIALLICVSKARAVLLCPNDHSSQTVDWQKHESASPSNMLQVPHCVTKIQPSNSWRHRPILGVTACLSPMPLSTRSWIRPWDAHPFSFAWSSPSSIVLSVRYALPHLSGDALPNLNNCASHFPSAFCVARANCPCESLKIFRCARATHTMLKSQHSASPLVNPTLQAKCHAIHHKPKRPFFIWVWAELHKYLSHMRSGQQQDHTSKCSH